jgi:hypothetical protein
MRGGDGEKEGQEGRKRSVGSTETEREGGKKGGGMKELGVEGFEVGKQMKNETRRRRE